MIKLSQNAHHLLKHIMTTTGEKEIAPNGQEVNSPRRLNGEEGAQRRFYLQAINPILDEKREEVSKKLEDAKISWKEANEKGDKKDEDYEKEMNTALAKDKELLDSLNAVAEEDIEVDLTDKTIEVIKKYFKEFGDKNGWTLGDDKSVVEIEEALA